MTNREIMQQAYDAMNDLEGYRPDIDRAMAALRQALAQPEQEPVAYADALDLAKDCNWDTFICKHSSENHEGTRFKIPLYTAPSKRERDLAQPEQEPVAWMWKDGTVTADPDRADGTWTPLYALDEVTK